MQAQPFQRAFNRLYYLKSHPNAQKQFGRIAAIKYSFQYSLVGINGLSFITAFSWRLLSSCQTWHLPPPPPHPHHMAKSILSVAAALKYNWSHMRYTWTLQPHPIYGAFLWVLFEFSHSISGNAFIVSRRCTNHRTTNVQSFKRSVTWTYCVLKVWKHYSHFMGSLRYIWKVDTKLHRKGKKK